MLPHLGEFLTKTAILKFDGAIRHCEKICEHLATAYYAKSENLIQKNLKKVHIDALVETGFD